MLIGYNTDVEHDGVVYHVQTEDKGLDTPVVLSLIYSGGAILASKRTPYDDLIAGGFDNSKLAERLNRQHRVICAAIRAGRIDDLRKLSAREPARVAEEIDETTLEPVNRIEDTEVPLVQEGYIAEPEQPPAIEPALSPGTGFDDRRQVDEAEANEQGLRINLIGEPGEFRGGEMVDLQIVVATLVKGRKKPVPAAAVSIKVLGTNFRPIIRSLKTDDKGIAAISGQIPAFTTGRAAILIRATAGESSSEIRRAIQPGG